MVCASVTIVSIFPCAEQLPIRWTTCRSGVRPMKLSNLKSHAFNTLAVTGLLVVLIIEAINTAILFLNGCGLFACPIYMSSSFCDASELQKTNIMSLSFCFLLPGKGLVAIVGCGVIMYSKPHSSALKMSLLLQFGRNICRDGRCPSMISPSASPDSPCNLKTFNPQQR